MPVTPWLWRFRHVWKSLVAKVGSLEDPKDFQGLAHFCEHMARESRGSSTASSGVPGLQEVSQGGRLLR